MITKAERMKAKKSKTCKTEQGRELERESIYSPVLLCLPCPFMSCFVYRAPELSHTGALLFLFYHHSFTGSSDTPCIWAGIWISEQPFVWRSWCSAFVITCQCLASLSASKSCSDVRMWSHSSMGLQRVKRLGSCATHNDLVMSLLLLKSSVAKLFQTCVTDCAARAQQVTLSLRNQG